MDLPPRPPTPLPASASRATTEAAAIAAAALRADVVARLRPACAEMPLEVFNRLVDDICARKRRWAASA